MKGNVHAIVPEGPNDLIACDIFGPLVPSVAGVKYIFVVLNVFTKFVRLYTLRNATAKGVVRKLENDYFPMERIPKRILSDKGTQFTSKHWDECLKKYNVQKIFCSTRYPQGNPSERVMRELGRLLRVYCSTNHKSWAKFVKKIELLINSAVHESTGFSPISLEKNTPPDQTLRKVIEFPEEKRKNLEVRLELAKRKLQSREEKNKIKNNKNLTEFKVGDTVWVKANPISSKVDGEVKKLFMIYEGPYKIGKQISENAFQLQTLHNKIKGTYNRMHLKHYYQ